MFCVNAKKEDPCSRVEAKRGQLYIHVQSAIRKGGTSLTAAYLRSATLADSSGLDYAQALQ